jgi:hypothetical protein
LVVTIPSPNPSLAVQRALVVGDDLNGKPGAVLIFSALAGGDCIDDANALRAGGTERILTSIRRLIEAIPEDA